MSDNRDPAISVTATIEGHPRSVLKALIAPQSNARKVVRITLDITKPSLGWSEPHWLPAISNGDGYAAIEHLDILYRQGFMTPEFREHVLALIEEFVRVTR